MEKTYKIEWIEQKQSAKGTTYHRATLVDEEGNQTENVAIFAGFTGGALDLAGTVRGVLVNKPYNGKPSYTLNSPGQVPGSGARTASRDAAQARVEKSVEKAQDRKEESIKHSAAQRDAVLLVTTFYRDRFANDPILESELDSFIKKKVTEFRDWLLSDNFTDSIPF